MRLSRSQLAIIALILANIIWGAALPIYKWALSDIGPATFSFLRFSAAGIFLLPFVWKDIRIRRRDIGILIILGLVGITASIGTLVIGLLSSTSINASAIGSSAPIFLILASVLFLHERVTGKVLFGTCVSLVGIAVIVLQPIFRHGLDGSLIGNLLFVLNTITNIIYTVLLRKIATRYSPLALTFWTFIIGALGFLPWFLVESHHTMLRSELTFQGITGLLYAIFFSAILAYVLYTYALKVMTANKTGVFMYLDPIVTILVAWPLLGEKLTLTFITGSFFVFAGIFIAEERVHWHPLHLLDS